MHSSVSKLCAIVVMSLLVTQPAFGWVPQKTSRTKNSIALAEQSAARIAVPASELDADLTDDERTVVSVVRSSGPSVAFVTSVLPFDTRTGERRRRRPYNQGRPQSPPSSSSNNSSDPNSLPRGQSLGSGSGFLVDSEGYLVTNYHVVESAYQMIEAAKSLESMVDDFISNVTDLTGCSFDMVNSTLESLRPPPTRNIPEVYVRISSDTRYQKCEFVDVKPELDVAVLKIVDPEVGSESTSTITTLPPVKFGSSTDLLVGQSLVAIGTSRH